MYAKFRLLAIVGISAAAGDRHGRLSRLLSVRLRKSQASIGATAPVRARENVLADALRTNARV